MADNITLSSGSGGDTLAADEISSVKYQRVKIQHGADGSATDVSTASPLPVELDSQALTAVLHSITAKLATDVLQNGLTAVTPKFAIISCSTGDNTIVAAVASKKIRVLLFVVVGETGDGTFRFEDGAGGTALTGLMPLNDHSADGAASGGEQVSPFCPLGLFETSVNTLLNIEANTVTPMGYVAYVEVA